MGLIISRHWYRDPGWFNTQPRDVQILLIADYKLANRDPKTEKKNKRNRMIDRIRERREEIRSQGAKYENH